MSDLQAMADRFEIEALRGEYTDALMMREPPPIEEERLRACLQDQYDLLPVVLEFL